MGAAGLGAGARMQSYGQLAFREELWPWLAGSGGCCRKGSKGRYLCVQRGFDSLSVLLLGMS